MVPTDLVLGCPAYRLEMRQMKVPHDTYVAVCGTDIVRAGDTFAVLEDNLRVPSGVSYMLACRTAMKWAFPYLYRAYGVREVAEYPERLYSTLASLALGSGTPRMAVLTPGRYNSAYYEHAFLAGEMGVDLVEGRDLVVHDAALGAAGLFHAYRAGNLVLANAPGTGVADDKGLYAYVPRIIRYFLDEEPILANVETHLCRETDGLAYTLEHLAELVVKGVGGVRDARGSPCLRGGAGGVRRAASREPDQLHLPAGAAALPRGLFRRRAPRAAPRGPPAIRSARPGQTACGAGRPLPRRAAQGEPGGELQPGRRLQGPLDSS